MRKVINAILKIIMTLSLVVGLVFLGWAIREFMLNNKAEKETTEKAIQVLEDGQKREIKKEEFQPEYGEAGGMLRIDKIGANIPIVEGTHEDDLRKGVGHYDGTGYPLDDDQIVLSGHRDTVFKQLPEVGVGDILTVSMPYGDFDYEIVNTKVVSADDLSIIVPHDEEVLTVTTCYPFQYIGSAPDRYIIDAKPVYDKNDFTDVIEAPEIDEE